jgi:hypothetical protein
MCLYQCYHFVYSDKQYEMAEFPPGSRLKVKYGKGKTTKLYEAKVLDCRLDEGNMRYFVHYNGWNVRYDEWVKRDRIMECLYRSDGKKALTTAKPPMSTSKVIWNYCCCILCLVSLSKF